MFKSLRIYHGTNLLVNQQFSNRLWQALYDIQCNSAERNAGQICLGIMPENYTTSSNNLFGSVFANGETYDFCFTLPCSLLGSLTDHALPLGWMGASSLYLELEVDAMNRIFTTRIDNDTCIGASGAMTSAPVYTTLAITDIYYNAKISQLGGEYDNLLMSAFEGAPIRIPSVEYVGEQRTVGTTTAFSDKFSFQKGSVNFLLWWIANQDTANGTVYTDGFNYNSAITQRSMGELKDYYITLNGSQYPTQPISAALNGATTTANRQFGSVAYQHLLRCFNQNTDVTAGGVLDKSLYSNSLTTLISEVNTKRFVAGISMDRVDGNNEKYMSGMNTIGSNFVLNVNWNTALSTSHFVYAFIQHDVAYELSDGLLTAIA